MDAVQRLIGLDPQVMVPTYKSGLGKGAFKIDRSDRLRRAVSKYVEFDADKTFAWAAPVSAYMAGHAKEVCEIT